jgi:D-alanine-D-alanine ligase
MKFAITYTLKDQHLDISHLPDDWQEELDNMTTIDGIAGVLQKLGHSVVKLGDGPELQSKLLAEKPDIVFNLAEGRGVSRSREAWVPSLLESLGIPYTASDPLTCAVTLEKDYAKRLVASTGVPVPPGMVVQPDEKLPMVEDVKLRYPLLVKPAWEGSSKGIRHRCLVHQPSELLKIVEEVRGDYAQPVLIEEYIQGEEVTVGLVGNGTTLECIGQLRVVPLKPTEHFVYSLEVKRDWENQVRYEAPPKLPAKVLSATEAAARQAFHALGCRDLARADFRIRDGIPYFLEINPLPGLNPDYSDLVILAREMGMSYETLITKVVNAAIARVKS